jgi:hypothetical protein
VTAVLIICVAPVSPAVAAAVLMAQLSWGARYFWDQENDEFATHAPYTNIKLCPLSVSAFQALAMSRTRKFVGGPSKSCDWGGGICMFLKTVGL